MKPLEGVRRIVCTTVAAESDFGNAANCANGTGVAVHVTDDPDRVLALLSGNMRLVAEPVEADPRIDYEFGPGLYVSAVPHVWMGRSEGKWQFLQNLTEPQRWTLGEAILRHPNARLGYLTETELTYVRRQVELLQQGHTAGLRTLAEQPFNTATWKPIFLEPLGIAPGPQAHRVPIEFQGRFAELTGYPSRSLFLQLFEAGLDGAYSPGHLMGPDPQLVIWRASAIVRFGQWTTAAAA